METWDLRENRILDRGSVTISQFLGVSWALPLAPRDSRFSREAALKTVHDSYWKQNPILGNKIA